MASQDETTKKDVDRYQPPCAAATKLDGIKYTCHLLSGHAGLHSDETGEVSWGEHAPPRKELPKPIEEFQNAYAAAGEPNGATRVGEKTFRALHGLEPDHVFPRFHLDERVRAGVTIVDGWTETTVPEGTLGTVVGVDCNGCSPLVRVEWDMARVVGGTLGVRFVTMVTNLERVGS